MKKMQEATQRKVNGGAVYQCRTYGYCWYTTPFKFAMGWHYLQGHGTVRDGRCVRIA